MTREIKFRAWDKQRKSMYQVAGFSFAAGKASLNSDVPGSYWTVELSNVEMMQFTGLYDKNGKEIYEGDIVKIVLSRGTVEYRNGAFIIVRPDTATYAMTSNVEVIGNIHESPELLEE